MTTGTAKLRRNNKVTPAEWQLLEEEVVRPLSILQVFDAFQVTVAVVWAPKLSMRLLIAPAYSDPESRSIELFQYLLYCQYRSVRLVFHRKTPPRRHYRRS